MCDIQSIDSWLNYKAQGFEGNNYAQPIDSQISTTHPSKKLV